MDAVPGQHIEQLRVIRQHSRSRPIELSDPTIEDGIDIGTRESRRKKQAIDVFMLSMDGPVVAKSGEVRRSIKNSEAIGLVAEAGIAGRRSERCLQIAPRNDAMAQWRRDADEDLFNPVAGIGEPSHIKSVPKPGAASTTPLTSPALSLSIGRAT